MRKMAIEIGSAWKKQPHWSNAVMSFASGYEVREVERVMISSCDLQQQRKRICYCCCYWVERRKASYLNKHGFSYTCTNQFYNFKLTVTMILAVFFFQCRGW